MMTVEPVPRLYKELTLPVSGLFRSRAGVCVTVVFRDLGLHFERKRVV